jgi:hypothetical protein
MRRLRLKALDVKTAQILAMSSEKLWKCKNGT